MAGKGDDVLPLPISDFTLNKLSLTKGIKMFIDVSYMRPALTKTVPEKDVVSPSSISISTQNTPSGKEDNAKFNFNVTYMIPVLTNNSGRG